MAASSTSSPKPACLPEACATIPLATVISPAGTPHFVAAACTNMARAAAPAARILGHESEMADEPPVPWVPPIKALP